MKMKDAKALLLEYFASGCARKPAALCHAFENGHLGW
jgi:hypothetical protein